MRLTTTLLLTAILTAACDYESDPIGENVAALYVDAIGNGHGPFVAPSNSSPSTVPPVGVVDLWSDTGSGVRWIGDMSTSTHPGYVIANTIGAAWLIMSNRDLGQTYGYACRYPATGPANDPCQGQSGSDKSTFNNQSFPTAHFTSWTPAAFVVGYTLSCPTTPGINSICYCSGAATPLDGSGYRTVVMHDPFGHSLMNPDGPVASDCLVTSSQFPGLIPPGETDVAVYSCPGC